MNLVFITDAWEPITGGGQRLYREVLTRLAKKGWQITVITRALLHERKKYFSNEELVGGKLKIIRLGPALSFFNPFGRLWFTIQSWWRCLPLNPDTFMATTWLPAFTLQLIRIVKKTPLVLLVIGFGSRLKWLENLITKKLKYDLIISDDYNYSSSISGIKFIPNGVDIPSQKGNKKKQQFTFLFVGRNEPRKGADLLQQAFLRVKRHYPQARLRLVGPGFKLVSGEQLDQELFSAHCLVLPARREGHPLILFEAWAHRLPVIATNVGSVGNFVNKDNGYLVEPGDVGTLAQAMIKAINNKELNKMGEAGYNLIKNYTWDKTASAYANSLESL